MNHIHQLQQTRIEQAATIVTAARELREFRAHLNSPKFGPQADGSRGDWIATADVLRRIETLLTILEA